MSDRKAYPSDLKDRKWELLEPLIPAVSPNATTETISRREIVNGILYVLRSGCPWRLVPHDLPAWGTVYYYFRIWRKEGIWDHVQKSLLKQVRQKEGRDEDPSAAVIDSQSIKTSAVRGPEKGVDMGKKIWGRKRHILVDTQGNLMEVKVTAASDSDLKGAKKLLEPLVNLFPRMQLVWGDSHYRGTLIEWVKEHLGWGLASRAKSGNRPGCEYRAIGAEGKGDIGRLQSPSETASSSSEALPGLLDGVASPVIMRVCLRHLRRITQTRRLADACFRTLLSTAGQKFKPSWHSPLLQPPALFSVQVSSQAFQWYRST
jgi:transposase